MKEWAQEQVAAAEEAEAFAVALAAAQGALDDMSSNFSEMARREDADHLDLRPRQRPIDALEATKDVEDAIRDLGDFIREEGVPNLLDPNDIDAGPYLDKFASLRGPIQAKMTEAFTVGGPEQAIAAAEAYVEQVTQSMRTRSVRTTDRSRGPTLLGLDDITARIKVAMDWSRWRRPGRCWRS